MLHNACSCSKKACNAAAIMTHWGGLLE